MLLVYDYYQIDLDQVWNVVTTDLNPFREQVEIQIQKADWPEWEKNETAIYESAIHKSLIQTVSRMKKDGMSAD